VAKTYLLSFGALALKDDVKTHALSSLIAGTVTTAVCSPADVVKSRLQSAGTINGQRQVRIVG